MRGGNREERGAVGRSARDHARGERSARGRAVVDDRLLLSGFAELLRDVARGDVRPAARGEADEGCGWASLGSRLVPARGSAVHIRR